jgi:hypothetical protein
MTEQDSLKNLAMKNILLFAALTLVVVLARCSKPDKEGVKVLADPEFRGQVMREILRDQVYLAEFTEQLAAEKGAETAFKIKAVKTMWESDRMDSLIDEDGAVIEKMMSRAVRRMDKDTNTVDVVFNKLLQNERFRQHVMRYRDQKKMQEKVH